MESKPLFNYQATVKRVVDGDTIIATVDLGFYVSVEERFRLARINAPELNSQNDQERATANEAKAVLTKMLTGKTVFIDSKGKDKYGRYIAEVMLQDGNKNMSDLLLGLNLAKPYHE